MSRNFQIGTKVRVKKSGEIGIVKGREQIVDEKTNHVTIEYVVKFGEGMNNWKSYSRRELENVIINEEETFNPTYPQIITTHYTNNKRTIVMVGVVDKVKFDIYNKVEGENIEVFVKEPFKGKCLTIGYAILHPEDEFDVLVGEQIALKRAAEHPISRLFSSFNGEFNADMVEDILRNKSEFIFDNINKFIDKTKY